jgi:hypothetical protein
MTFKIDPTFERYWPPLPEEKFVILEKSILEDGLRENLIVWEERGILLDGHQRLRVLKKHSIPYADRITPLSFPDEVHAKHWVHVTQAARRGDAPQFLSICHVLEFEPIYREEAKGRMLAGKKTPGINDTEGPGRSRVFMARDSAASEMSVARVLYIKAHDTARFASLKALAEMGEDYDNDGGPGRGKGSKEISIHLEWSKVKAKVDADAAGVKIAPDALEKFTSSNTVRDFAETVTKFKPSPGVQRAAAEAIVHSQETADKNFVEDQVIHRLPKREPKKEADKSGLTRVGDKMDEIAGHLDKASSAIGELRDIREEVGEDIYFQAFAERPKLRAGWARLSLSAKSFQNGGSIEKKKK